jgi:hypothetical protein
MWCYTQVSKGGEAMTTLQDILPANRVAAIATWLAALGALILAVEGTLPTGWENAALAVAALLTKAATALKFMTGSQKYDALTAAPQLPADMTVDDEMKIVRFDGGNGIPADRVKAGLAPGGQS